MKKILFGILVLFLVALVPSVSALVTWDPTAVPADIALVEDTTPDPTLDLSTLITGTPDGVVTYSYINNLNIDPIKVGTMINSATGLFTFTLVANQNGDAGEITFEVNDNGVVNQFTAIVTISNDNADVPTGLGTDMPSSINEDEQVTVTLSAVNPTWVSGDVTFAVVSQPTQGSLSTIDPVSHEVVYTPNADYYGPDQFTVKATNVEGDATLDVDVAVTRLYDDAPVLPTLDDYKLQEKMLMNTVQLLEATDPDGVSDTLTYLLEVVSASEESTFAKGYVDETTKVVSSTWSGWNAVTRTISGWTPDKDDIGELKLRLIVYDSQDTLTNPSRDEQVFSLHVYPDDMCEYGDIGSVLEGNVEIEKPDDDDEFGPGDIIRIKVTVEPDVNDDRDYIVEAVLYSLETHKRIGELVVSDKESIDGEEDEEFTFELELRVPVDSDEDYKGNEVLYIKVYEDDDENVQCLSDMVRVDISRESHEVIIQSMTITPSVVIPGDSVDVSVLVRNIGRKDEEGVVVKLRSEELGISLTSDAMDLGETGNYYWFTFKNVKVPLDLEAGTFNLEASYVLFDDGATIYYYESPTYDLEHPDSQIVVEQGSVVTGLTTVDEVTTDEETTEGNEFPWSTIMWIVGDIVLIIVAIFFLKLIFSGRKRSPEVKEVKL